MPTARFALWVLVFFLQSVGLTMAQRSRVDSIRKILQGNVPDTTRAYNLTLLAMYMEELDLDSAHQAYKEAVDFSLSKGLDYFAGLALRYQATPYGFSGNRAGELDNIQRAIMLQTRSKHPKAANELAACYGNLSNYYRTIELFDSAVAASLKSIALFEQMGDHRRLSIHALNLAMIYQQIGLPDKQLEYVNLGLKHARLSGNPADMMMSHLQRASYYTSRNLFVEAGREADSATRYFDEGKLDFSRKQNFFLIKAGTFQNLKAYDSAVYYFQRSYELAKQAQSNWNMCEPLIQIGYIYLQKKNYSPAEKFIRQGLAIAEKDSIRFFMKEGYGILSEVLYATGRYKEAWNLLKDYETIKDTLLAEDRRKFALDLEKKYETEKKDARILLQQIQLKQRRTVNIMLTGGAAALLIVLALSYRNYRNKQVMQQQRINELETEKQLMASEAVIKGEEQERTRLAKDLHDGLGGMLSGIKYTMHAMKGNLVMTPENSQAFERSMDMLDSSIREMRRVAQNLMPETLVKFGLDTALRDFCNDINQSGVLQVTYQSFGLQENPPDQGMSITIYRIIQELVNNILKHAAAKSAMVQVSRLPDKISLEVEDDGKGLDTSILDRSKGIGWSNIRNRVHLHKGMLDIQSSPDTGTSVHIEFRV